MSILNKIKIFIYHCVAFIYAMALASKRKASSENAIPERIDEYFLPDTEGGFTNLADSILIYAATVGELRAASVFIQKMRQTWPNCNLIIVPGQRQYAQTFFETHPYARVMIEFPSVPAVTDQFFRQNRIKFCVFVEGPSLHGYFPIRQDLSLPVGCLKHQVPIVIINACLYKKQLHSRIDLLEHRLFSGLFRLSVKHWYVPTAEICADLRKHQISKHNISVVGDIKFDNVFSDGFQPSANQELEAYIHGIGSNNRMIVAGSVNAFEEQKALVLAWLHTRSSISDTVLILAPRYINDKNMMARLTQFLRDRGIEYALRSESIGAAGNKQLIIIDTFGELAYFYKQADIAFAGRGHGVLEPMKYLKPVVVGPHEFWTKENSTSYLLYQEMRENQALIECSSYAELGGLFLKMLEDTAFGEAYVQRYMRVIKGKMGASEKIIEHMSNLLNLQSGAN